jgi:hypothetical protein
MICKLNLIEVVVLTALLAIMIGFAVGVIESMITRSHFPPWLAVPAGMVVALVVVGDRWRSFRCLFVALIEGRIAASRRRQERTPKTPQSKQPIRCMAGENVLRKRTCSAFSAPLR